METGISLALRGFSQRNGEAVIRTQIARKEDRENRARQGGKEDLEVVRVGSMECGTPIPRKKKSTTFVVKRYR